MADIADLSLSVRAAKRLAGAGIQTVEQLVESTSAELLSIRGLGRKSLQRIEIELRKKNLTLASMSTGARHRYSGELEAAAMRERYARTTLCRFFKQHLGGLTESAWTVLTDALLRAYPRIIAAVFVREEPPL